MATVQIALVGVCYISEEHARLSGPPHHRDTLGEGTIFSFLCMCALSLLFNVVYLSLDWAFTTYTFRWHGNSWCVRRKINCWSNVDCFLCFFLCKCSTTVQFLFSRCSCLVIIEWCFVSIISNRKCTSGKVSFCHLDVWFYNYRLAERAF